MHQKKIIKMENSLLVILVKLPDFGATLKIAPKLLTDKKLSTMSISCRKPCSRVRVY